MKFTKAVQSCPNIISSQIRGEWGGRRELFTDDCEKVNFNYFLFYVPNILQVKLPAAKEDSDASLFGCLKVR